MGWWGVFNQAALPGPVKGGRMVEPEDDQRAEFSRLYEENYRRIFNFILYGTSDVETAMDLTSETFFKAFRAWPHFEDKGVAPTAWFLKIASRELAMFYRRQGRLKRLAPTLEFTEETAGVRRHVCDDEVRAAQRELERQDDLMALAPLIKKLPAKYREVRFLRFFAGMQIEEISQALDRPVGTVKAQLHRALRRLRDDMQPSETYEHFLYMDSDSIVSEPLLGEEVD